MDFCMIFDLDGTLIDSRADLTTGVNLMRKHYGLEPLTIEIVTTYVGNGTRKLCERSIAGTDIDIEEALPMMKGFYQEHLLDQTALYEGVEDGLRKLYKLGVPMAVVTNKPKPPTQAILEKLKVSDLFVHIIGSGQEFELKPAPDALNYVIRSTGCEAAKSLMVGDNYTDLESGRRAGMRNAYCNYGFGHTNGENYEFAVDSFGELVEKVSKML